jgi:hypothetical protein
VQSASISDLHARLCSSDPGPHHRLLRVAGRFRGGQSISDHQLQSPRPRHVRGLGPPHRYRRGLGQPGGRQRGQHQRGGGCTVSGANGSTVNYTGAGDCVVDANQVGNTNYSAAPRCSGRWWWARRALLNKRSPSPTSRAKPFSSRRSASRPPPLRACRSALPPPRRWCAPPAAPTVRPWVTSAPGTCMVVAGQAGDVTYSTQRALA